MRTKEYIQALKKFRPDLLSSGMVVVIKVGGDGKDGSGWGAVLFLDKRGAVCNRLHGLELYENFGDYPQTFDFRSFQDILEFLEEQEAGK